ncbi:hydrolase [Marmoricola endophyticus]|uniref:Hydrolase n=1 Tax=Marmoricola endophyticus TaxID=2040280 RepID=A0A917BKZ4_9ACTN|nr:carbon-nitrogen hydrolase family protein [Marmoricola endophyticus]GGF47547.1 hydrolase [Marmoricola endophyticus]
MRLALAQVTTGPDPRANLEIVREQAARAAGEGADLVVLPEATMRCFGGGRLDEVAEPVDGPWADAVAAAATEHGVTVVAGMFTPNDDGRVSNTLLVASPGGERTSYDKVHLYDAFGFKESDTVAPGSEPVTVEIAGTTVGLAVCYDVRFPGLFTALAREGAEVVLLPASWGAGPSKVDQWRTLVRARALDATVVVAAAGQAPPPGATGSAPTGVGHSMVVGPTGQVLGELGDEPGLLVVDVDGDQVAKARAALPVLANARF